MPKMNKNRKCIVARESWELHAKAFPSAINVLDARRKAKTLEEEAKAFIRAKHSTINANERRRGNLRAVTL